MGGGEVEKHGGGGGGHAGPAPVPVKARLGPRPGAGRGANDGGGEGSGGAGEWEVLGDEPALACPALAELLADGGEGEVRGRRRGREHGSGAADRADEGPPAKTMRSPVRGGDEEVDYEVHSDDMSQD